MNRLTRSACFLLAAWVASAVLAADDGDPLPKLQALYRSEMERIEADSRKEKEAAAYGRILERVSDQLARSGDLEGVLAVKAERARLLKEKTIPTDASADLPPAIREARASHRRRLDEVEFDRFKRIATLAEQYTARLDALKTQLTRDGKIERATAVKSEADRVKASPEVTSAQFALADKASREKPGPVVTPAPKPEPSGATPGFKTITAKKRVQAGGNMTSDWTPTALRLEPGDIVTVSASGLWKCTYETLSCGPEGYTFRYRPWAQEAEIPYGALLAKVGPGGAVMAVGKELCFTNQAAGLLYLDANVKTDRALRKECSGALDVSIEVKRSSGEAGSGKK